ncbi:potassium voltage-gated channel subfamily V member 1 [Solea senegalensis]|uniref:Potassium voltage-gated channel subfamily V member 1 n=1 Tax=Solea senegalensis TaxID=28829 RepID=A0AAV6PCW7_SOLSE|nr:potassium voltage-gated channel subfamily V member 1 [Solea senegalensis]
MTLPSDSDLGAELHSDSTSALSLDSSVFFSETMASCVLGDVLVVNVGGRRHALSQELLASHPETRLGKLARCSRDAALELCDDADLLENEFFFDRNARTFQ